MNLVDKRVNLNKHKINHHLLINVHYTTDIDNEPNYSFNQNLITDFCTNNNVNVWNNQEINNE